MNISPFPAWPGPSLAFPWQAGPEVIWDTIYIFQTGAYKPNEGKGLI